MKRETAGQISELREVHEAPLQRTADCQGEHYRLQLNIYKWILEKYYGVKVTGMKVVCVHPRYLPDGSVDEVPDMQDAINVLMQSRVEGT